MRTAKIGKPGLLALALCLLLVVLTACSQNPSNAYQKAVDLFAAGDYEGAARAFERLGDYQQAEVYAAYSRGLVLYEQGNFAAAEPYFEKAQDFMYGKARYTYCRAYVQEQAGQYAEAAELYRSLGDFENAAQAASYCVSRLAEEEKDYETALYAYEAAETYADAPLRLEELQFLVYEQANRLKLKGNWLVNNTADMAASKRVQANEAAAADTPPEEPYQYNTLDDAFLAQATDLSDTQKRETAIQYFQEALHFYTLLGDYYNSVGDAAEVKEYLRNEQYLQAEAMEKDGRIQEAYEAFAGLVGYSDAQARMEDLAAKLGISLEGGE